MKLSVVAVTVVGVMRVVVVVVVVATLVVVGVVILQNVEGIVAGSVVVENPRRFLPMDLSGCLLAFSLPQWSIDEIGGGGSLRVTSSTLLRMTHSVTSIDANFFTPRYIRHGWLLLKLRRLLS